MTASRGPSLGKCGGVERTVLHNCLRGPHKFVSSSFHSHLLCCSLFLPHFLPHFSKEARTHQAASKMATEHNAQARANGDPLEKDFSNHGGTNGYTNGA